MLTVKLKVVIFIGGFRWYAKGIRSSVKAGSTKCPYVYYALFVNESHQSYFHHVR